MALVTVAGSSDVADKLLRSGVALVTVAGSSGAADKLLRSDVTLVTVAGQLWCRCVDGEVLLGFESEKTTQQLKRQQSSPREKRIYPA